MADDYPRILTRDELRFDISFAIGRLPRGLLREWASTNELKSDRAKAAMVDLILTQLSRYQVRAPAPTQPAFWSTGNKS